MTVRVSVDETARAAEVPTRQQFSAIARLWCVVALLAAFHAAAAVPSSFRVPVGEQSIRVAIPAGFANAAELGPALLSYVQALVGSSGHILGLLLTPADIDGIRLGRTPMLSEFLSITTDSEWSSRVMTRAQFTSQLANLETQLERNAGLAPTSTHVIEGTLIQRFSISPNCEGVLMAYGPVSVQGAAPRSAIQGIAIMHVRGKILYLQVTRLQDSLSATERTKQQLMSWAKGIDTLNAAPSATP